MCEESSEEVGPLEPDGKVFYYTIVLTDLQELLDECIKEKDVCLSQTRVEGFDYSKECSSMSSD